MELICIYIRSRGTHRRLVLGSEVYKKGTCQNEKKNFLISVAAVDDRTPRSINTRDGAFDDTVRRQQEPDNEAGKQDD